jgi:hypothetical protein
MGDSVPFASATRKTPASAADRPRATEPDLVRAGEMLLRPAAALLARLGSPLLTVSRFRSDPPDRIRLFAWTDRLEPGEEIARSGIATGPELAPLHEAGAEALRQVSLRWPAYAVPSVVGLVTDGTGIAVSGEHPSGLTSSWLIDQIEQRSAASIILPFDPNGVWALVGLASGERRAGADGRRH